jgi:2-succinyl-5-enolpyruvyl-6-hydroxy-3-cyclohexene-1-carboxylate synthase
MRAADPAATAAMVDALFAELVASGVGHAIVSPGSRSAPLAVGALRAEALGLCVRAHADERSAAFFALGVAKASGAPSLLVCTSGSAAANYLPAVVEAWHAGVPLILLTADRPPELQDCDAGQTIDQSALYGTYLRWRATLPLPEPGEGALRVARSIGRRAVASALGRQPGPVHLNWPLREPLVPPRGLAPMVKAEPPRFAAKAPLAPSEEQIEALAELARSEDQGLVVAGPALPTPGLAAAAARFATAAGWPIVADAASQLRCGPHAEHAPLVTTAELLLREGRFARTHAPRAVLRLGAAPTSKALRLWLEASPPPQLWLVDPHARFSDPSRLASERLEVDPVALLDGAASRLGGAAREGRWCRAFQRAERAASAALERALEGEPALLEPRAVRELAAALPDGALLYLSNSMPVRDADAFLPASPRPLALLANRGANGIDGLVSSALGAASVWPRPAALLTGDLAFLHDLGGLAAARALGRPLVIVVLNNDGGGIFSFLPIAEHGESVAFERLFRTPHGLDLRHAGALFGLRFTRVASWEAFRVALKDGLARDEVSIVEVPVDAAANVRQFRALAAAVREAAERAVFP